MHKDALIMGLGVFVAALPFLGFPGSWDTVLMVIAGVLIIALGIAVRRGNRPSEQSPLHSELKDDPSRAIHGQ